MKPAGRIVPPCLPFTSVLTVPAPTQEYLIFDVCSASLFPLRDYHATHVDSLSKSHYLLLQVSQSISNNIMSTPLPFSLPKEPTKSIIDVQINLFPDSPCVFIHNQTMSSADAAITRQVIENLPASSFLGKWAIGVTPDSPATDQPGPVRALATVYKEWHQGLDQHVTVNLDWVVTHHDNLVRRLATVHLYASGIESVREHRTGTLWFRQPGADTWTMTPNVGEPYAGFKLQSPCN